MAGLEMKYFVLKPRSKYLNDPYANASRVAMDAYADIIEKDNPDLAYQLREWVDLEFNRNSEIAFTEGVQ